jgi:hypothetical protein
MSLTDAVREFFASEDWPILESEPGVFETAFEGSTTAWPCRVHVFDEDERVVLISAFPAPVDDELRPAVGEFCHRANFGLAIGNFELDYDGGEVRFRTSIDVEGSVADAAMVRNAMVANVLTMDRYVPGLLAVLAGIDPADAIEDVEETTD